MKLRFTPQAARDLVGIADYIRERNPDAAQQVRAAILDSLQNLILFPQAGRAQTTEGVRKLSPEDILISFITRSMRMVRKSSFSPSSIPRRNGYMKTFKAIDRRSGVSRDAVLE
jgi:plasmid stabilization system protein ParE